MTSRNSCSLKTGWRARAVAGLVALGAAARLAAAPQGATVSQGTATVTTRGAQTTIQTSDRAFINWQSFNIGVNETTTFLQPSASSVVWNRINDPNSSQLLGTLNANGYVVLQNAAGFYVGGQASLNTAGLILTTTPTPPPDLAGGGMWEFNTPPPAASIVNLGQINAAHGGSVFLIARDVENAGSITAPGGNIGLFSGEKVLMSNRPDGLGLSAQVVLPNGSVDNAGRLVADAGTIALHAQVVNQGGLMQANSIREVNGVIEVVAGDSVTLGAGSQIQAKGDAQGTGAGGVVRVQSGNSYADAAGSVIDVSGGATGGNGGEVEISAPQMSGIASAIAAGAAAGWQGGKLTVDPLNITLSGSGGAVPPAGTVNSGDAPAAGTLALNINSFAGLSQIELQASQNITVAAQWSLGDSLDPNATLTLRAGNNITVNSGSFLKAGQNWTLNLFAGVDFTQPGFPVIPGTAAKASGSVVLNGTGILEAANGNLNILAGQNVTVGNGAIRTVGGGNINVTADFGSVSSGFGPTGLQLSGLAGYDFGNDTLPGYSVSDNLTGISTAAGGNVTILAGQNVISPLPIGKSLNPTDAGTGAFGPEPGVVTITAQNGSVSGHYVAANSTVNGQMAVSTITAGQNAGTPGKPLALSLAAGGWSVSAPNGSIVMQEVRNPNGTLNAGPGPGAHRFDYDPLSFVNLTANLVELVGDPQAEPRNSGDSPAVPNIYAPTLNIVAGAGGIKIDHPITLFPSPQGQLNLTTTAGSGGSLSGGGNSGIPDILMSDIDPANWSPATWRSIAHAAVPVHANEINAPPVTLNIDGDINSFFLFSPKVTHITARGNMNNSYLNAQNLHAGDSTSITVGGQLFVQNQETFHLLNQPLDNVVAREINTVGFLDQLVTADGVALFPEGNGLHAPQFFYTAGSTVVATTGRMTAAQLQALANLDVNGNPISLKTLYLPLIIQGVTQVDPATGKVIVDLAHPVTFLDLTTISDLYTKSQVVPNPPNLANLPADTVGGPGHFVVTANSVDLGLSGGIQSRGPADNLALGNLGPGADITLNVAHDLNMFSATIASFFGGDININAGGTVNVGSSAGLGLNNPSAGIYTVGPGDVNIDAIGTIDVAGSRVATFNGGKISLTSETGDVKAGEGAATDVQVAVYQLDPNSGKVLRLDTIFNGSGILAYTLPLTLEGSVNGQVVTLHESATAQPGDITITTPKGSIFSGEGGIVQEPLNGNESAGPKVTLTAGTHNGSSVSAVGNIDLGGSGVIGGTVILDASGDINGLVIGRQDTLVNAVQNFSGTVLAGGSASVSAGGTASGTIIGITSVSVGGGGTVDAALLSQNVSVGGAAAAGLSSTATASAATQGAAAAETASDTKPQAALGQDDEELKKRAAANRPLLTKLTGRVTVILPGK